MHHNWSRRAKIIQLLIGLSSWLIIAVEIRIHWKKALQIFPTDPAIDACIVVFDLIGPVSANLWPNFLSHIRKTEPRDMQIALDSVFANLLNKYSERFIEPKPNQLAMLKKGRFEQKAVSSINGRSQQ